MGPSPFLLHTTQATLTQNFYLGIITGMSSFNTALILLFRDPYMASRYNIDIPASIFTQSIHLQQQGSFHTEQMLNYDTNIVAGITPGKGGQKFLDRVPIFNSIEEEGYVFGCICWIFCCHQKTKFFVRSDIV